MGLPEDLFRRMRDGFLGKSLTTPSRWAEARRVMGTPFPGPWSFNHFPWLRGIHDSTAELNIGQKGAQVGYTESLLNIANFHIDVLGHDVLYVLPSQYPDATNFSAGRFNPMLELSPYLKDLYHDASNTGHKRAGCRNLYVRGSRSRSGLKSIPVALVILDEVEEMDEANVTLARERTAGQLDKMVWAVSTPSVAGVGINKLFLESTQERFIFPCPHCDAQIELKYPESIVITGESLHDPKLKNSHYICYKCKGTLPQKNKNAYISKGKWQAFNPGPDSRGFYVNQLYSVTVTPYELAQSHFKAQASPDGAQELYNSKLGLPYTSDGAQITDAMIQSCLGSHKNSDPPPAKGLITAGIDVGSYCHYEIDQWFLKPNGSTDINSQAHCKVLRTGKVKSMTELDVLMREMNVTAAVIDANPEKRAAHEFASRFPGRVRQAFYGRGIHGKDMQLGKDDKDPILTVDRTSWLDLSLSRFRTRSIELPIDTSEEVKQHLKSLVRVYERDSERNPIGRYVCGAGEDHAAHARNYAEMALPLAASFSMGFNLKSVY